MSTSFLGEVDRRDRFVIVEKPDHEFSATQVEIAGIVVEILGIRNVRPKRLKLPSLEDRVEPIVFLADVNRILEGLIQEKRLSEELVDQAKHVKKTLYEEETALQTLFSVAGEALTRCIKNEIPIWWKVYERNEEPILFLESLIYGPRKPIPRIQRVKEALKKYFLIEKILRAVKNQIFHFPSDELELPSLIEEAKETGIEALVPKDDRISWFGELVELEYSAKSSLEQVCLQNQLEVVFTLNGMRIRFGSAPIDSADLSELDQEKYEILLNPTYFLQLTDQAYEMLLNLIEIDFAVILELEKEEFEMIY